MSDYNLNFHEMTDKLFTEGGSYQGNAFKDGVFICLDQYSNIHLYEYSDGKFGKQDCGTLIVNDRIYNQHYKRVYGQPEIMRKC